jgi:outer membrane protein OmpA-like peptidoglycan-associated protein
VKNDALPTTGVGGSAEDHWIPLSDLMTGLMMFFLLLAVVFMVKVQSDAAKVQEIAVLYDQLRVDLYQDLDREFKNDLPRWGAELHTDLSIRFREPDVLFETGSAELRPRFKTILNEFFPRYVAILTRSRYRNAITEVRIEGHTSSVWYVGLAQDQAYLRNMDLSQSRTRSTLGYVLEMPALADEKPWLMRYVTANGLSSSHIIKRQGVEDQLASQRVEFRVRTDADARIAEILRSVKR